MDTAVTTQVKVPDDPAAALSRLPVGAARMAAVEILLSEPETLGDDILESCLYVLRERLRAATWPAPQAAATAAAVRRLPRRETPPAIIAG
jgi:hypothetical protein